MIKQKHVPQHVAGCGLRRQGKLYMYSDMKKHTEKYPFGYFLYDPPIVIDDLASWGICPQGISYVFLDGYYHAVDWIGENNYPNAADILEEAYIHGGSGLLPLNPQVGKLVAGKSRRLLVHPRGYLQNNEPYKENYVDLQGVPKCFMPDKNKKHPKDEMCASLHWQTITEGVKSGWDPRGVTRKIGDTAYEGIIPLESDKPVYSAAIIGWFPIDELHLVNSDDKSVIEKALALLNEMKSTIPTFLTDF